VDLTGSILQVIGERGLQPGRGHLAAVTQPSTWRIHLAPYAAAAAVLLVLGLATYVSFVFSLEATPTKDIAQIDPGSTPAKRTPDQPKKARSHPEEGKAPRKQDVPNSFKDHDAFEEAPKVAQQPNKKPHTTVGDGSSPPEKQHAPLTDRFEMFHLDRVPDILPVIFKVTDFEQEAGRKRLSEELRDARIVRLELPCLHGTRAFERLQRAAQSLQLALLIDKQAQDRIKMKWRTSYLVYLEGVTPNEVTRLVEQIRSEDRKRTSDKKEPEFDRLVLTRMSQQQGQEWSSLLGIEPQTSEPASPSSLTNPPANPLRGGSQDKSAQSSLGKGNVPRNKPDKKAEDQRRIYAPVFALNAGRPASNSEEIKLFLEKRTPVRSGTVRVFLVLRS
jgi:hypothetical protein